MRIINFLKKDIVLCIAVTLALISMTVVPPDKKYIDYIDFNTLFLLFSLMAVMAGFRRLGLFDAIGKALLKRVKTACQLTMVLVFLPFFFSMVITNDVALITFVPLSITVLSLAGLEKLAIPVIILQTLAANLGSMLTPMGNPQNLYLYGISDMTAFDFIILMLPLTLISFICLLIAILIINRRSWDIHFSDSKLYTSDFKISENTISFISYTLLFILSLMCVGKLLPAWLAAAVTVIYLTAVDRPVLKSIDYSLLGTFTGFFIFIGNMSRIPWFCSALENIITGNETLTAIVSSQIISNVPAALLLSGFTGHIKALIIGTNLGGLGTMIASMASLISYKQLAFAYPEKRRRYFLWFTITNIIFLMILMAASYILNGKIRT